MPILKAELYPKLARVQLDWVTPCAAHLQVSWEKMRKDGHLPVDARCPVRGTPYRIRQSRQGVTLYCPAYHDLFECVWTGWPTHYFGFTHTPPWYPLGRGTYELFVGPKGKVHRVRVRRSTLLPDDTGHLGSTIRFPDAKGASRTTGLLRVEATWTVPEQG